MSDEIVNENTPENPAAEEAVVPTEAGTEVAAAAESVDSSPSEDASPVAEGGKFDKLKKAEDILRANAPPSYREESEDSFVQ